MNKRDRLRWELRGLIAELYDIPFDAVQLEMLDFFKVVSMGAKKYEMNNWLKPDGVKASHDEMHYAMFRHLYKSVSYRNGGYDEESKEHHLLHVATRALMSYTRKKKRIEK